MVARLIGFAVFALAGWLAYHYCPEWLRVILIVLAFGGLGYFIVKNNFSWGKSKVL
jgi:hypothetical protein